MGKHTELPWKVDMYLGSSNFLICKDAGSNGRGIGIAETVPGTMSEMENAKFIVRAVNNHQRLVEALRELSGRVLSVVHPYSSEDTERYREELELVEQARTLITELGEKE